MIIFSLEHGYTTVTVGVEALGEEEGVSAIL